MSNGGIEPRLILRRQKRLGCFDRFGAVGDERVCQCLYPLLKLVLRHNLIYKAEAISLCRIDDPAGQQQIRLCLSPICNARKADTSAGTKPMRTSVKPNFAAGVASVKSHIAANPAPPAMAAP